MTGRDDFPDGVIEEIRKRVGGRCSMPSCRAATTGPSESRTNGVTNVQTLPFEPGPTASSASRPQSASPQALGDPGRHRDSARQARS
jgi:hypothetical protein